MKPTLKTIGILVTLVVIVVLYFYITNEKKATRIQKAATVQNELYLKGEELFKNNCSSCHYIGMDKVMTAPALGGITKRRDKRWLYRYTRNSYGMYKSGDSIAIQLRSQGWGLMPSFPQLNNIQLEAIYYFVEQRFERTQNGIPVKE
jgi:mono/diheme cytochrome c family protein